MLNYLRSGEVFLGKDEMAHRALLVEAEFYQIKGLCELLKTRLQVGAGIGPAAVLLRGLYSTCLRNAAAVGVFWVAFEASAAWRAAPKAAAAAQPAGAAAPL